MTTGAIHRIVEQQAALRSSSAAVVDGERTITYRDLNYAANALARHLMAHGFRRGAQAIVTAPVGIDLAIVLLAVLKMGGSYTWNDPGSFNCPAPCLSFAVGTAATETQYFNVDLSALLTASVSCSPNLPIVTRASDIACVMQEADGTPVMVPHATIAALCPRTLPPSTAWGADPGVFDLWIPLMAGATALADSQSAVAA